MSLRKEEKHLIYENAYIPEHIFTYVEAISGLEPFFYDPYVYYIKEKDLVIVGYPLDKKIEAGLLENMINGLAKILQFEKIKVISPFYPLEGIKSQLISKDKYFLLNIRDFILPQKIRNMINRASKEIYLERTKEFTHEHKAMIEKFLIEKPMDDQSRWILRNIEPYILKSDSALMINARDTSGILVAFNVVDCFSKDYLFYMFNITSKLHYIPGVSDFLFFEMVKIGIEKNKNYLNLGLGINDGIRFFKEKWGGKPFISYFFIECKLQRKPKIFSIIDRLTKI